MIDKVKGLRIASDTHYYLIELFKYIQDGWIPPDTVSEELYKDVQKNKSSYQPQLVGFIGFGCSYSGKWFGGYARGNDNKGNPRNYCLESKNNILKQKKCIDDIDIHCEDYKNLEISKNSIIYCDPPYADTTKYSSDFNHELFWEWCREKHYEGHTIFISEYNAPKDFIPVWKKTVNNSLTKQTGSKQGVERLFTYVG